MQMTLGKVVAVALSRQRRKAKEALDRAIRKHGTLTTTEDIDLARRRLRAVNILIEEFKGNEQD